MIEILVISFPQAKILMARTMSYHDHVSMDATEGESWCRYLDLKWPAVRHGGFNHVDTHNVSKLMDSATVV